MYHKNESIDAHVKPNIKTFTWSWNDAAASVLVSKKVVLENVILKIQLGKSSSMSKFLSR
jgi:alanine racemase